MGALEDFTGELSEIRSSTLSSTVAALTNAIGAREKISSTLTVGADAIRSTFAMTPSIFRPQGATVQPLDAGNDVASTLISQLGIASSSATTQLQTLITSMQNIIGAAQSDYSSALSVAQNNVINPLSTTAPLITPESFTPTEVVGVLPEKPKLLNITVDTDVPNIQLVDAPDVNLVDIEIPNPPDFEVLSLDDMPFVSSLDLDPFPYIDTPIFNFSSDVYTLLMSKLIDQLTVGGTGLGATVEDNIWNRAYHRQDELRNKEIDEAISLWASRGFSVPADVIDLRIRDINFKFDNERIDLSNKIAADQAELAQKNNQFLIEKGIAFSDLDLRIASTTLTSAIEVSKMIVQLHTSKYEAMSRKFLAEVELYKAYIERYNAQLKAQLAEIEIYKVQVEGAKIKGELKEQQVKIYLAMVEAYKAQYDGYRTKIMAIESLLKTNQINVELYKAQVDAHVSQYKLQEIEAQVYTAQLGQSKASAEVYSAEVDAYRARVEAAKAKMAQAEIMANVALKRLDANSSISRVSSEVASIYTSLMSSYASSANAMGQVTQNANYIKGTNADLLLKRDISMLELDVKDRAAELDANVRADANKVQAMASEAKIKVEAMLEAAKLTASNNSYDIQATAQLLAASLGMIHMSASFGQSQSLAPPTTSGDGMGTFSTTT